MNDRLLYDTQSTLYFLDCNIADIFHKINRNNKFSSNY